MINIAETEADETAKKIQACQTPHAYVSNDFVDPVELS